MPLRECRKDKNRTGVAMSIEDDTLGPADVTFSDGQTERYAAVELLNDGVLKTTQRAAFEHPEFGTGIGETQVAHAPHTWRYVELVAIENGTLWVSDADWESEEAAKWEQLAGCVSVENAYQVIADYLLKHYAKYYGAHALESARTTFNLEPNESRASKEVRNDEGEPRRLAFRWASTLRATGPFSPFM